MCASLGVHNFCTTGSPICSLLDVSYVPCIRTGNTQFKGRAREHNSLCLTCVYVCVVIPSIIIASAHLSVYSVWAHQPGSHRRKANTVVFSFWGEKRHISAQYCVLYYCRCVACVCVFVQLLYVCGKECVCVLACLCARYCSTCAIYVWLIRCARACACKDVSGGGGG